MYLCCKHSLVIVPDNDAEDEGPSNANEEKKATEPEEGDDGQEADAVEASDGEEVDEAEDDIEQEGEGDSEEDGGHILGSSMSNRSESKPYSSVTHKCGVRHDLSGVGVEPNAVFRKAQLTCFFTNIFSSK